MQTVVQVAAIPRFFDRTFLNALLDQLLDEEQFTQLLEQSYIEPYPGEGRYNIHERNRKLLQEKLWQEDEALYREISSRAFVYCAEQDQDDTTWRIETLYHHLIAEPEEATNAIKNTCAEWMHPPYVASDKTESLLQAVGEHLEMKRQLTQGNDHFRFQKYTFSWMVGYLRRIGALWRSIYYSEVQYAWQLLEAQRLSVNRLNIKLVPNVILESLTASTVSVVVKFLFDRLGKITDDRIDEQRRRENTRKRDEIEQLLNQKNIESIKGKLIELTSYFPDSTELYLTESFKAWFHEQVTADYADLASVGKLIYAILMKKQEQEPNQQKKDVLIRMAAAVNAESDQLKEDELHGNAVNSRQQLHVRIIRALDLL